MRVIFIIIIHEWFDFILCRIFCANMEVCRGLRYKLLGILTEEDFSDISNVSPLLPIIKSFEFYKMLISPIAVDCTSTAESVSNNLYDKAYPLFC